VNNHDELADLGHDAALSKVGQQKPDAAEVEVPLEDHADPLGLVLLDEELGEGPSPYSQLSA
jgi:hypothetical protein